MKKTLLSLALSAVLLSACGSSEEAPGAPQTPTPTQSAATADPSPTAGEDPELTVLKACAEKGLFIPAESSLPEGVTLSAEFLEQALVRNGNTARIRDVMLRAAKGEAITLGYLGGSITAGSNASPMDSACWAALTTDWWKHSFPDADFQYVNAGIGATDSYVGVHRVADEILSKQPDVVVVEFSVNDSQPLNVETYESLLRCLLDSESRPAVVPLMLCTAGSTFAADHAPLAMQYDLPIIAYFNLFDTGMLAWEQAGDTDGVHPKNEGHAVIASLMCSFYESVLEELAEDAAARGTDTVAKEASAERSGAVLPEETSTECRYTDASFLYADSPETEQAATAGFSELDAGSNILKHTGWTTEEAGSFSFETKARTIGLAFSHCDDPSEAVHYMIYVDDVLVADFDNDTENYGNGQLRYITALSEEHAAHHTVKLVPAPDNSGTDFTIYGWAIGK